MTIFTEAAMGVEINAQVECNSEYIQATAG